MYIYMCVCVYVGSGHKLISLHRQTIHEVPALHTLTGEKSAAQQVYSTVPTEVDSRDRIFHLDRGAVTKCLYVGVVC